MPDNAQYEELNRRLIDARAEAQAEDIRTSTQRAKDLMAVTSFGEAEKVAQDLLTKHPSAPDTIALLDSVRREREAFVTEAKRRAFEEVEKHAGARRWRQALSTAKRLLEAYPNSAEAEVVAARIPAMEDNARIEEVRELRDEIRDLLERRRFAKAVRVAEVVIRQYPETKAASELREQLEKLKELARTGGN